MQIEFDRQSEDLYPGLNHRFTTPDDATAYMRLLQCYTLVCFAHQSIWEDRALGRRRTEDMLNDLLDRLDAAIDVGTPKSDTLAEWRAY